jgi:hypothetical protein
MSALSWLSWDGPAFRTGLESWVADGNGDFPDDCALSDFGEPDQRALIALFEQAVEWNAYDLDGLTLSFTPVGDDEIDVDVKPEKSFTLSVKELVGDGSDPSGRAELARLAVAVVAGYQSPHD